MIHESVGTNLLITLNQVDHSILALYYRASERLWHDNRIPLEDDIRRYANERARCLKCIEYLNTTPNPPYHNKLFANINSLIEFLQSVSHHEIGDDTPPLKQYADLRSQLHKIIHTF